MPHEMIYWHDSTMQSGGSKKERAGVATLFSTEVALMVVVTPS